MHNARESLVTGERGAVLVMAAFMACFLAGCLWFLIGIGEAIAFREKAQGTADAVAFSSAAVHARGMNLLCALNLVLVAIVAVYIVLRYVMVLCRAVLKVTGIPPGATFSDELDTHERLNTCLARAEPTVCKVARGVWSVHENVHKVLIPRYHESVMKDGVRAINDAEVAIAALTPALAEVAAFTIANERGYVGIALSPSLLPDDPSVRALVEEPDAEHDEPLEGEKKVTGLPVSPEKIGVLCDREAGWAFEKSRAYLGPIWVVFGPNELESRPKWCGPKDLGGFFTKTDGPVRVFSRAHNGSEWTQIFGLVVAEAPNDVARRRVRFADGDALRLKVYEGDPPTRHIPYFAQAEIYFDCDGEWHDASCNGGKFGAMYAMRWRARLVRVRGPGLLRRLARSSAAEVFADLKRDLPGKMKSDDRTNEAARMIAGPVLGRTLKAMEEKLELLDPGVLEGDRWLH